MNSADKILLFFFLLLLPSALICQDLQQQYFYSKVLYEKEMYFEAVTEFKRLLFFDSTGRYEYEANFLIGSAYKAGGYFDNAVFYFSNALLSAHSSEEEFRTKIEIVRSNILRKTFSRAHNLLDEIKTSEKENEVYYWRGWAYMLNAEWNRAAEVFSLVENDYGLSEFCRIANERQYSITAARVLSYLFPGAGQFYTGEYLSGAISLAWNALWGYLTINAFIEERVLDGFIVANFLWFRFYRGNIHNAEKFADEKNQMINADLFRYLRYGFNGLKP